MKSRDATESFPKMIIVLINLSLPNAQNELNYKDMINKNIPGSSDCIKLS